jgi:putative peptidoglycan lipid II flippase
MSSGDTEQRSVLANSAVMAAGTVLSRVSGFARAALLVAALGSGLHADVFTTANTVPNMLYILLAGGIFNAVLVPQLVRSMKNDADGGDAYANRIVTLAALFLGVVTVLLVVAAPWLMRLFVGPDYADPALAAQWQSVVDFARLCLPQVFFYGMFVLVGQILNARGSFGPMMWAPIANNLVAITILGAYLGLHGAAERGADCAAYSPSQELLLGLGSTAGIVVQLLILLPYLRRAGFRFSPRFDFRGTGLGHTLRLGGWTVGFVIVNQIAYTVVVNLANSGTAQGVIAGCSGGPAEPGSGITVYSMAYLILMVPHAVVTVSLATAILPRLSARAAERDLAGLGRSLAQTLRTSLAVIVPFAALLPVVATDLANTFFGHGAGGRSYELYAPVLAIFGPALAFFTVHYLVLRGFYSLERNRTAFWIQCVIAAVNIVAALLLVGATSARNTAPALAGAFLCAYAVGSVASYTLLRHLVGGLDTAVLVRFAVRMAIATGVATAAAYLLNTLLHAGFGEGPDERTGPWLAAVLLVVVVTVDVAVFLGLARVLRIREVGTVLETVLGPVLRRRRRSALR